MSAIDAIAIYPDKRVAEVTLDEIGDYQAIVEGYIERVELRFGTLWVNEEFLLGQFGPEDANWIASDVAGLGGRPEFMLKYPILGPAILTGGGDRHGYTLSVTRLGREAVERVGKEAGAKFEPRGEASG